MAHPILQLEATEEEALELRHLKILEKIQRAKEALAAADVIIT